jgi:pimeloyl-ACP methyl ester carboxylesterase
MPFYVHDGRPLHYLERGRGEPLVLIHGLGLSGADWALQVPSLESRFRIIVPDLPGSGHSARPRSGCSISAFAASLWALIDHLGESRVNIVGFSLGGAVGLEMALQRPDCVARLALINSLATYRLDCWAKWWEACVPLLLVPLLGMRIVSRLAAWRLFPSPSQRSLRARTVASLAAIPASRYLCSGIALIGWSVVDRLHHLKAKTLVIAAEHDFTPLGEKRALAQRIGAGFVLVRGSRHGTPFDAVRATNASLSALLNDQPLPPPDVWIRDETSHLDELAFAGSIAEEHSLSPAPAKRARAATRIAPLAAQAP